MKYNINRVGTYIVLIITFVMFSSLFVSSGCIGKKDFSEMSVDLLMSKNNDKLLANGSMMSYSSIGKYNKSIDDKAYSNINSETDLIQKLKLMLMNDKEKDRYYSYSIKDVIDNTNNFSFTTYTYGSNYEITDANNNSILLPLKLQKIDSSDMKVSSNNNNKLTLNFGDLNALNSLFSVSSYYLYSKPKGKDAIYLKGNIPSIISNKNDNSLTKVQWVDLSELKFYIEMRTPDGGNSYSYYINYDGQKYQNMVSNLLSGKGFIYNDLNSPSLNNIDNKMGLNFSGMSLNSIIGEQISNVFSVNSNFINLNELRIFVIPLLMYGTDGKVRLYILTDAPLISRLTHMVININIGKLVVNQYSVSMSPKNIYDVLGASVFTSSISVSSFFTNVAISITKTFYSSAYSVVNGFQDTLQGVVGSISDLIPVFGSIISDKLIQLSGFNKEMDKIKDSIISEELKDVANEIKNSYIVKEYSSDNYFKSMLDEYMTDYVLNKENDIYAYISYIVLLNYSAVNNLVSYLENRYSFLSNDDAKMLVGYYFYTYQNAYTIYSDEFTSIGTDNSMAVDWNMIITNFNSISSDELPSIVSNYIEHVYGSFSPDFSGDTQKGKFKANDNYYAGWVNFVYSDNLNIGIYAIDFMNYNIPISGYKSINRPNTLNNNNLIGDYFKSGDYNSEAQASQYLIGETKGFNEFIEKYKDNIYFNSNKGYSTIFTFATTINAFDSDLYNSMLWGKSLAWKHWDGHYSDIYNSLASSVISIIENNYNELTDTITGKTGIYSLQQFYMNSMVNVQTYQISNLPLETYGVINGNLAVFDFTSLDDIFDKFKTILDFSGLNFTTIQGFIDMIKTNYIYNPQKILNALNELIVNIMTDVVNAFHGHTFSYYLGLGENANSNQIKNYVDTKFSNSPSDIRDKVFSGFMQLQNLSTETNHLWGLYDNAEQVIAHLKENFSALWNKLNNTIKEWKERLNRTIQMYEHRIQLMEELFSNEIDNISNMVSNFGLFMQNLVNIKFGALYLKLFNLTSIVYNLNNMIYGFQIGLIKLENKIGNLADLQNEFMSVVNNLKMVMINSLNKMGLSVYRENGVYQIKPNTISFVEQYVNSVDIKLPFMSLTTITPKAYVFTQGYNVDNEKVILTINGKEIEVNDNYKIANGVYRVPIRYDLFGINVNSIASSYNVPVSAVAYKNVSFTNGNKTIHKLIYIPINMKSSFKIFKLSSALLLSDDFDNMLNEIYNNPYMGLFMKISNTYIVKIKIFDTTIGQYLPNWRFITPETYKVIVMDGETIPINFKFLYTLGSSYIMTFQIFDYSGKMLKSFDVVLDKSEVNNMSIMGENEMDADIKSFSFSFNNTTG